MRDILMSIPVLLTKSFSYGSELLTSSFDNSGQERVVERVQQGNADADHRDRIQQTSDNEQFGLQLWHQFRLTSRSFQEFAAQNCETECGADSGQADDDCCGQNGHALYLCDQSLH